MSHLKRFLPQMVACKSPTFTHTTFKYSNTPIGIVCVDWGRATTSDLNAIVLCLNKLQNVNWMSFGRFFWHRLRIFITCHFNCCRKKNVATTIRMVNMVDSAFSLHYKWQRCRWIYSKNMNQMKESKFAHFKFIFDTAGPLISLFNCKHENICWQVKYFLLFLLVNLSHKMKSTHSP